MLFNKNIPHRCDLCIHSSELNFKDVVCDRHGVVAPDHCCRRFKYDALRRVPTKNITPVRQPKFTKEDFEL